MKKVIALILGICTTLYIRQYTGQQLLQFGDTGKRLTITIPTDARLDALDINASSASIDTEVDVNTLQISTSSGQIHASAGNPEYAELSTSSGDVELTADSLHTLAVHTSSGRIRFFCRYQHCQRNVYQ